MKEALSDRLRDRIAELDRENAAQSAELQQLRAEVLKLEKDNTALERFLHAIPADIKKLRANDARYRWLRDRPSYIGWDWWQPPVAKETIISPEFMDAQIDEARKAK